MRTLFLTATQAVLLGCLSMLSAFGQQPSKGTIKVTIEGCQERKGQLIASIYNSEANYMKQPYRTVNIAVEPGEELVLSFQDIPHGEYALAVFHDKNSNNELDKNWMGIPKEDYGFSNNVRPTFRAANYDESRFNHTGASVSLLVKVE